MILMVASVLVKAQSSTISGNVKDDKGNALHYVYITDDPAKTATFTDSLGNFNINVPAGAKLKFQHSGYKTGEATAAQNVQVVLTGDGSKDVDNVTLNTKGTGTDKTDNSTMGTGGVIAPGHLQGNVHGNRYLLDNFAHGFLIDADGELVHTPGTIYDYDKMSAIVLSTADGNNVAQLSFDKIKSFTLYSDKDVQYMFGKEPSIDPAHYVQILASGKKYRILKVIKTKFIKSDFVNNGVVSHGNDYDEYVDDGDYYVLDVQSNQAKKFSLKKKGIKEAFPQDADKVNKFLSDNRGDIDDAYLGKLGNALNQ